MGMFDDVDAPAIVCRCGATVDGWQSKDGPCELRTLSVDEVNNYYSYCKECGRWHKFTRTVPPATPFEHSIYGGAG